MIPSILVGAGGFAGALARFAVSAALAGSGGAFPLPTFLINVIGSTALGWVAGMAATGAAPPNLRALVGTGFLGAFTTFSTFSMETVGLIQSGRIGLAALYTTSSVGAGIVGALIGLAIAERSY